MDGREGIGRGRRVGQGAIVLNSLDLRATGKKKREIGGRKGTMRNLNLNEPRDPSDILSNEGQKKTKPTYGGFKISS